MTYEQWVKKLFVWLFPVFGLVFLVGLGFGQLFEVLFGSAFLAFFVSIFVAGFIRNHN